MSNLLKKIGMWINGAKVSDIPESSDVEINQKSAFNRAKSGANNSFNGTISNSFNRGFVNTGVHYGDVHFPLKTDNHEHNLNEHHVAINGEKIDLSNINDNQSITIEIHGNVNNIYSIAGNINIIVHGNVQQVKTEVGNIDIRSKSIVNAKAEIGNVIFTQTKGDLSHD